MMDAAAEITALWDDYRPTTLIELPDLARRAGIGRVFLKNESERPFGNFKALGGMVAGLRALGRAAGVTVRELISTQSTRRSLPRLICASDGNHGLSVAAAAKRAGTKACIYLPVGVSRARAERIEGFGAQIMWINGTYDDAVDAAMAAAGRGDGLLIPDTSADPNDAVVKDVMDGYALLTRELAIQFRDEAKDRPSHVFVQAGVGGLAAAVAQGLADTMRAPGKLLVVEPLAAACVARALAVGHTERIPGDLHTAAEMLSCGVASVPALEILRRHDARSVQVDEEQLQSAVAVLQAAGGPATTPSGAAGVAGLVHVAARPELRSAHQLGADSSVLVIVTEGPVSAQG
ncbi:MAG: pyridoxal-phosphate dependent enzyme [Steroidobacteraceae bacterium]